MQNATATPIAISRANGHGTLTERHAWMCVAALLASGLLAQVRALPGAHERNDFAHYYLSATILLEGDDPYRVPLLPLCEEFGFEYDARIPYGANPPLLIRMFTAIAWLPPHVAFGIWTVVQIAALVLLLEATRRVVGWRRQDVQWWLFIGLVLSSTSLQAHVYYSQVQVLVAAGIATAFLARLRGRHLLACGIIALAGGFKLYPAVLLPWFVFSAASGNNDRLRRAGVVALVSGTVLAVTGPAAWLSFIHNGLPVLHASKAVTSHTNYSLQAMLTNSLTGLLTPIMADAGSVLAAAAARVAAAFLILAVYVLIWRRRLDGSAALCLLVIVMIAASPVAWSHYMVLMVLPAAMLFRAAPHIESRRLMFLACLTAGFSLMPDLCGSFWGRSDDFAAWAVHYYPLYVLGLAGVLVARFRALGVTRRNTALATCRTG